MLISGVLAAAGLPDAPASAAGPWIKLQTPNAVILSNGGEKPARGWAVEFEQFVRALDRLFEHSEVPRPPLTVVLFATREAFLDYAPVRDGLVQPLGGYFTLLPDRGLVALPVDAENEQVRRTIFHEAVHWYFSRLEGFRPVWFDEGMAEVFSTFQIKRDEFVLGHAVGRHVDLLRATGLPPLAQTMKVLRDSIDYNESLRATGFYAHSWLIVHHLIFGRGGRGTAALADLLGRMDDGSDLETAFREAFQVSTAEMGQQHQAYLFSGKYGVFRGRCERDAISRTITPAALAPGEVELALASLAIVANRPAAARSLLDQAGQARPGAPEVEEARGLLALSRGDDQAAKEAFARALQLGSRNFICYFSRAAARARDWQGRLVKPEDIPPAEAREIAYDLQRSINLEPICEPAFEYLAEALAVARPLSAEDRRFLELGVRRYPRNAGVRIGLAAIDVRLGRPDEAIATLDAVFKSKLPMYERTHARGRQVQREAELAWGLGRAARLLEEGAWEEAEKTIVAALAKRPGAAARLKLLELQGAVGRRRLAEARRLFDAGDRDGAAALLERTVDTTPDVEVASEARGLLDRLRPDRP